MGTKRQAQRARQRDWMNRTNSRGSGGLSSPRTWAPTVYRQDGRVWHPRWARVVALVRAYHRLQEALGDWASPVLSAAGCLLLTAAIVLGVALWVR